MAIVVTVEPGQEAISVDQAKEHLNVLHDLDDLYIHALIRVARETVENLTARIVGVSKTVKFFMDEFPQGSTIFLPLGKTQGVTSLKYYDTAGVLQTLSSDLYFVDLETTPSRICVKPSHSWPSTELGRPSAVVIEFMAGYPSVDSIPAPLVQAMKLLIGHWYANREDVTSAPYEHREIPNGAKYLALPYRVY